MRNSVQPLGDLVPAIDPEAWVAESAIIRGNVTIRAKASVFYGTVVRSESEVIEIGARSNLQDMVVVHTDPGHPVRVGAEVTIGHRAILHGCTIEDRCLIGMGSVVMNGAHIGTESLIAAGTVVPAGTQVPPGSLVSGVPGRIRRELTSEERKGIAGAAHEYLEISRRHAARADSEPLVS